MPFSRRGRLLTDSMLRSSDHIYGGVADHEGFVSLGSDETAQFLGGRNLPVCGDGAQPVAALCERDFAQVSRGTFGWGIASRSGSTLGFTRGRNPTWNETAR